MTTFRVAGFKLAHQVMGRMPSAGSDYMPLQTDLNNAAFSAIQKVCAQGNGLNQLNLSGLTKWQVFYFAETPEY